MRLRVFIFCFSILATLFFSTNEGLAVPTSGRVVEAGSGDPIEGGSTRPTVTTSHTITTIATSHSSTILFYPLDAIGTVTEDTSMELTGHNSTADTE